MPMTRQKTDKYAYIWLFKATVGQKSSLQPPICHFCITLQTMNSGGFGSQSGKSEHTNDHANDYATKNKTARYRRKQKYRTIMFKHV